MLTYGFYNSVRGDRKYDAIQMSSIFDGIITDGVFDNVGDSLMVRAGTGMQIIVGSGRAWFNHTWTYNDTDLGIAVQQSEIILDRIDALVLEINEETRMNRIIFIPGTPASEPEKPELVNTELIHQYPLAYVTVRSEVTEITAADIENAIGLTDCPFITAPLEHIDATELVTQWSAQIRLMMEGGEQLFLDWFQHLMDELTEHQAANLQRQIDEIQTMSTSQIDSALENIWV
ncbi:MAG: hypothetical protein J6Y02_16510 [Pseudobutyrivibrio sp.]|nr:hypothetical protein [Pseudobutyrivibrio sp.]